MKNRTILQNFEWNLPADQNHWKRTEAEAARLAQLGFTDIWLPPAYKGISGRYDVGYGVYDLYDLGEFDQKGSVPTKYGTKEEYIAAIDALHRCGMRVLADIVLNHRMGADFSERVWAHKYRPDDRLRGYVKTRKITAMTGFQFPGRKKRYSAFKWNHTHFSGVDYNADDPGLSAVYKLCDHRWSRKVDDENQNYDYLMGSDVDFSNPEVRAELDRWGKWYIDTAKLDGVRLDAVKHISYAYFPEWLGSMRAYTGTEFFAVGEYWHGDHRKLLGYLHNCGKCMSLFDVSLHYNFYKASCDAERYDLRTIFRNTLVEHEPWYAVTFVDNHDTQPGQMLQSWVRGWFKPLAYALTLLRRDGLPCVFYGDLYGLCADEGNHIPAAAPVDGLQMLLLARKEYAYGGQRDYFDSANLVGWTREGGMAVVMSNHIDGSIWMEIGEPGQIFTDLTGSCSGEVIINADGWGEFRTRGRSVSVWVRKDHDI